MKRLLSFAAISIVAAAILASPSTQWTAKAPAQEPTPPAPIPAGDDVTVPSLKFEPENAEPGTPTHLKLRIPKSDRITIKMQPFDFGAEPIGTATNYWNVWPSKPEHTATAHVWLSNPGEDIQDYPLSATLHVGPKPPPPPVKTLADLAGAQLPALIEWYGRVLNGIPDYLPTTTNQDILDMHAQAMAKIGASADYAAAAVKLLALGEPAAVFDRAKLTTAVTDVLTKLGQKPGPIDPPAPAAGLRILVLEEAQNRASVSAAQIPIITGNAMRAYIGSHKGQMRVLDDDSDVSLLAPQWQADYAAVKAKAGSDPDHGKPWWLVGNDAGSVVATLPATLDEALSTAASYGGK